MVSMRPGARHRSNALNCLRSLDGMLEATSETRSLPVARRTMAASCDTAHWIIIMALGLRTVATQSWSAGGWGCRPHCASTTPYTLASTKSYSHQSIGRIRGDATAFRTSRSGGSNTCLGAWSSRRLRRSRRRERVAAATYLLESSKHAL